MEKKSENVAGGPSTSRFQSFAPLREKQLGYWFVNAKGYMESIAKAILLAKEEIFITDWWLSPEIMLVRPNDDDSFRLDNLLGKVADQGVRVYVIVFKEISSLMSLNSLHSKRTLLGKSTKGNIRVIRHPDRNPSSGVFLWSHHEKIVIIDQKIAFIGGIDLCFGRWDDDDMRITDLGEDNDATLKIPSALTEEDKVAGDRQTTEMSLVTTTGVTENADENSKKSDTDVKSTNAHHTSGSKHFLKIAKEWIKSKLSGTNHSGVESDSDKDQSLTTEERALESDGEVVRRPQRHTRVWRKFAEMMHNKQSDDDNSAAEEEESKPITGSSTVINGKKQLFVGKDYMNLYEKDFEMVKRFNEDFIDRTSVPRTPWHDEAIVVFGAVARDVANHFIQRWNSHKRKKFLHNDFYPLLSSKTDDEEDELIVSNWKDFLDSSPFNIDAQCVRSVGPWSAGINTIESSIENAYVQMIDDAKHFIYIENQFFITIADDPLIHNRVADALYQRILRANTQREKFRIYIVLPLLPGFDNVNAVQAVLYFIMRSIAKGDQSLLKRLEKAGVPYDDYISFYGMRAHDVLMGVVVTEAIYVHSALMIVDDHMAICGSAHINDRSLRGSRDSELCVVINDLEEESGRFNGQTFLVGKCCSSWRKKIFAMMLGTLHENPNNIDVTDPVSDEFYHFFRTVAKRNTSIYEEVFCALPSDRVRRFDQVDTYTAGPKLRNTDPVLAQEKLRGIQGLVVEYPVYFLDEENYLPSLRTVEGLLPSLAWT